MPFCGGVPDNRSRTTTNSQVSVAGHAESTAINGRPSGRSRIMANGALARHLYVPPILAPCLAEKVGSNYHQK